jgi:hypothetical protein
MDQNKFFWLYRKSSLNACGSGWHLDPAVLTGGGLIGSAGGWRAMRAAYEAGIRLTSDERILGSSSFVEKTLDSAGEDYDRWMRLKVCVSRTVGWVQADQALKKMSKTLLICVRVRDFLKGCHMLCGYL